MNAQPQPIAHVRLLARLTGAQRDAVTHALGPLVIVAGPGSGKTLTLTRRIAWLLNSGAAMRSQVVAVTFTVKATAEMRIRLADLLGARAMPDLMVGTFHSLCARILREHAGAFDRNEGYSVWDTQDQEEAAVRVLRHLSEGDLVGFLERHGLGTSDSPQIKTVARQLLSEISFARNTCITPEGYEEAGRHPAPALVRTFWSAYDKELQSSNAFDFDQLLSCTATLLQTYDLVRAEYRRRWPWFLVDEFQDTNPIQMEIIKALCAPVGNVTVCGDDDQAIYRFRGSDIENLLTFDQEFGSVRRVVLDVNFRSRPEIVAAASRCVEHNIRRQPKQLTADLAPGGHVQAYGFPDDEQEAAWVADEITRQLDAGVLPGEILVLFRARYLTRTLEKTLRTRHIPFGIVGDVAFYQRKVVKDAIAYLGLLANPCDQQAFRRCVASPSRKIADARSDLIAEHANEHQGGDLILALNDAGRIDGLADGQEHAVLLGEELRRVREEMWRRQSDREQNVARAVTGALMIEGGLVRTLQRRLAQASATKQAEDAEAQLEELRALREAALAYENGEPETASIGGFRDHLLALDIEEVDPQKDRRVKLCSVHRSKGGEAACVFLVGCEEGALPARRSVEQDGELGLEEERRVFYVGATRAKDLLVLTHVTRRGRVTDGPSRFLNEARLIG